MKKIAGIVVILAVLILGAYYLMGYQTERGVNNFVKALNAADGTSAKLENYQRGWFSSDAVIATKVKFPERVVKSDGQMVTVPAEEYSLNIPLKIKHGPFIFSDQGMHFGMGYAYTEVTLPEKLDEKFQQLFSEKSDKPVLRTSLFVSYTNKVWISIAVPKFTLYGKNNDGKMVWEGMTSAMTVSGDASKLEGKFDFDGFQLSKKDVTFDMKGIEMNYDFDAGDNGLLVGQATLDFPGMKLVEAGKPMLEVNKVEMTVKHDIDDGLFSSSLNVSMDKILVQGETYGPGKLSLAIRNLDAEILARVNKKLQQLNNASEDEARRIFMGMLPELPALLSKGATFELSTLTFSMPQGTINGQLMVSLPAGEDIKNPFALLQKIKGDGKLSIPAEVVKAMVAERAKQALKDPQTRQMLEHMRQARADSNAAAPAAMDDQQMVTDMVHKQLDQLAQSGMIVKKGSDYYMEFKLENGSLTINGKPISPAMLR